MEDLNKIIDIFENAGIKVSSSGSKGYNTCVLPDGSYMIKDTKANYYKIPKDYDGGNFDLVVSLPGCGEGAQSYIQNSFRDYDTPSNTIVVVASDYRNSSNVDERTSKVIEQLGGTVSNVEVTCFSGSGYTGSELAAEYAEKGYNTTLYATDPHIFENSFKTDFVNNDVSSRLANNNVDVYLNITSASTYNKNIEKIYGMYAEGGCNTYLLKSDTKYGHTPGYKHFLNIAYGDGDFNYNAFTGPSYNELTPIEMSEIVRYNNYENYDNLFIDFDLNNIFDVVPFTLDETGYNKYSHLKSLNFDTINVSNLSLGNVSSNLEYVSSFSNSILSSIKSDSLLDATTLNIPQGCGPLADTINRCLGLYYDSVGVLLNNLAQEAGFVLSVGNIWENGVDANLSVLANDLQDSSGSDRIVNNNGSVVNNLSNIDNLDKESNGTITTKPSGGNTSNGNSETTTKPSEGNASNGNNETTTKPSGDTTSNGNNETTTKPSGDTTSNGNNETTTKPSGGNASNRNNETTTKPSGGNASNGNNETTTKPSEGNASNGNNETTTKPSGDTTSNGNGGLTVSTNDMSGANLIFDKVNGNRRELLFNNGDYNVYFEMINNEVVSMKYQYVFDSYEGAYSNYELLLRLKENQNIENIILNGNMIEIVFKDKIYENMDINTLLEKKFIY